MKRFQRVIPLILALTALYQEPITRDGARREAARELSKNSYVEQRPSALGRLIDWVGQQVEDLLHRAADSSPGGGLGLLTIVVVIVGVVIVVLVRFGPLSRSAHREPRFDFGSMDTSVEEHRTLADRFAAEGRYAESVRERLRAVVRDLERRELVHPRPGRTVTEIIADVAGALPSAVVPMTNGARIFSDIWYGGEPASLDDDERLREIERQVLDARAGENDGSAAKPSWALPGSGAP